MKNILCLSLLLLLVISSDLFAQRFKLPKLMARKRPSTQWYGDPVVDYHFRNNFNPYATVGFGGGTSNYYGDLTSYKSPMSTILKMTRWNISANYTKHFMYNLSARVAITYARISGDDNNFENLNGLQRKYSRGLHFRNDLKEISLVGMYDFAQNIKGGFEKRQMFTPFLYAGVAFANHEPLARNEAISGVISKEWLRLRELDTEGQSGLGKKQYSSIAFSIPFGMGFRYKLNNQLDFSAEGGIRPTFGSGGKYLDDVSGDYIATAATSVSKTDSERFSYRAAEPYAARIGQLRDVNKVNPMPLTIDPNTGNALQRGNGRQDWYFITCFQLNYYISKNINCPSPN